MAPSTEILVTLLILGVISIDLAESFCRPGAPPIFAGSIALPTNPEILPLSVFENEIVGNTFYGQYQGTPPGAPVFENFEVRFTRPNLAAVQLEFRFTVNGTCTTRDRTFTQFFLGSRAEFASSRGAYAALISSDPSSYVWVIICRGAASTPGRRCPVGNLIVYLLTQNNPPDNLNLEMVGRDLRTSTCLTMELIPDLFNYLSIQGENTCSESVEETEDLTSLF